MHTTRSFARPRRLSLALLATLTASAALFAAQPVAAARSADPYTQGQSRLDKVDAYTQGHKQDKADPFTQGADRQADTYGYLSWRRDRFDPYAQGADQQRADTRGVLAWRGDSTYPSNPQSARA
ncbi:hypothetical protein [Ralstonia sp. 24A2]|uniref:hypothetical protein n=1 Tax=Ralstonia sp. 24A2 TaxID=3447364 RepID=UPI003F6A3216